MKIWKKRHQKFNLNGEIEINEKMKKDRRKKMIIMTEIKKRNKKLVKNF